MNHFHQLISLDKPKRGLCQKIKQPPIKALYSVKDQANKLKTYLNKDLDYKEYISLLQLIASNYDDQFKINVNMNSSKVYFHDTNNNSNSDYDKDFSIDTSVDNVLAYLSKIYGESDNTYYLIEDRYKQLSPEYKEIWNMLPKDIKSITLKGSPSDIKKAPFNT